MSNVGAGLKHCMHNVDYTKHFKWTNSEKHFHGADIVNDAIVIDGTDGVNDEIDTVIAMRKTKTTFEIETK